MSGRADGSRKFFVINLSFAHTVGTLRHLGTMCRVPEAKSAYLGSSG